MTLCVRANVDAVIHCAAAVDAAEDNVDVLHESQRRRNEKHRGSLQKLGIKMGCTSARMYSTDREPARGEPDDEETSTECLWTVKYEEACSRELVEKFFTVRIAWVFGVNRKELH